MCEIFGATFPSKEKVNSYLSSFFEHSHAHPHGWGLATGDNRILGIEKEPVQATQSSYLQYRIQSEIREKITLAHIRYATMGQVEFENAHPFQRYDCLGRQWTLIHNGTIFEYPELESYIHRQRGQTDSERVLLYLIDYINAAIEEKGRELTVEERFELLDKIVIKLSVGNKINFMLYDQEMMYVHCNYYRSLHYLQKNDGFIFATTPLSDEPWKRFPIAQMMAFQDGKLVYEGTPHGHEYVEIPENTKFLYTIFSDL